MSISVTYLLFFFIFSSRRRHTRWNCDWSSDVCSSDLRPCNALDKYLNPTVRKLQHPHNHPDCSGLIEVFWLRFFIRYIPLCCQKDQAFLGKRHINLIYGFFPANKQRNYHKRKDYYIPYRQKRQGVGDYHLIVLLFYLLFFITHSIPPQYCYKLTSDSKSYEL